MQWNIRLISEFQGSTLEKYLEEKEDKNQIGLKKLGQLNLGFQTLISIIHGYMVISWGDYLVKQQFMLF